jgi:hypothetical protein
VLAPYVCSTNSPKLTVPCARRRYLAFGAAAFAAIHDARGELPSSSALAALSLAHFVGSVVWLAHGLMEKDDPKDTAYHALLALLNLLSSALAAGAFAALETLGGESAVAQVLVVGLPLSQLWQAAWLYR